MSDNDPAILVEITSEVVSAYMAQNHVPPAEIPALIASVHAAFVELGRGQEPGPAAESEKLTSAVFFEKSISDEFLVSLEDGKRYKTLKRHLTGLAMTPEEYRAKWGLPRDYPMVAPAYGRARSKQAKAMGLGQKLKKL